MGQRTKDRLLAVIGEQQPSNRKLTAAPMNRQQHSGLMCRCKTEGSRAKMLCRRLLHWLSRRKKTRPPTPPPSNGWMAGSFAQCPFPLTKGPQSGQSPLPSCKQVLGATWPQAGHLTTLLHQDETLDDDEGESGFEDDDTTDDSNRTTPAVKEWNIPWEDLQLGDKVAHGRHRAIYKGRWHGEVLIHTFAPRNEQHIQRFLRQVTSLIMIRHENLALFMGACVEPKCLAIVTSMRTGPSLFEFIHVRRENIVLTEKIHIAHQVAQAMGYLHAKRLVHGRLTSRNVFLEGRVQVSLLDHGLPDTRYDRSGYGCLPRGHLTYFSPEMMRSLRIDYPRVRTTITHTEQSDIYAFGTILYELLTYRWPLHNLAPHAVIWQIASGAGVSLENFKGPAILKQILSSCWSTAPHQRPLFPQIVRQLQRSVALQRRFSSSEPERLNRLDHRLVC